MDIYFQSSPQPMVIYFTGGFNFNSYLVNGGGTVLDGNYGDITVNGAGSNWIINTGVIESGNLAARNVTFDKLPEIGAFKFLGRHNGTVGDIQEVGIDGGLEFHGSYLRRSAITGDINIAAGSNISILSTGVVSTVILGGDITPAGKDLLNDVSAADQRNTLGLGTAATADALSFESAGAVATHAASVTGVHGISTFASTLLDDISAAMARNTLELGTAATAATSDFAATSHTHTLSNLTQSGAVTGQIIQWNGSAWVPVTFTAGISGTLGATDNALLRADGTGGTTAQGSSVTLDDSANLLASNWIISNGTFGGRTFARFGAVGTNLALILSPTGTGFISTQVPDGTTAGGNLRGNNAIDFCYNRSAATQVASGVGAFNGGASSTASGTNSFAWCGQATNGLTFAMFGNASGNWSISIGQATSATANGALAAGEGAQATGDYSAALCYSNATGPHSVATGNRSLASLYGQFAHASGRFTTNGDCQATQMVARATTTDATPTTLFLDGASHRILVPANSRGRARITTVAATSTAGGEMMTWTREVAWWRGVAASTTEVDVQTIGTDRGRTGGVWGSGPPWGFAITADTINGGFSCTGTGAGATNIRWTTRIDTVMEVFP